MNSSGIRIREAISEDMFAIMELKKAMADYHRALDAFYLPGEELRPGFENFLRNRMDHEDAKIIVLETAYGLSGYFIGIIKKSKPFVVPEQTGHISDAFIEESYRGKGWGKRMLKEILDWFKRRGITHVELSVDVRNRTGVAAWEALGFVPYMFKMRLDL